MARSRSDDDFEDDDRPRRRSRGNDHDDDGEGLRPRRADRLSRRDEGDDDDRPARAKPRTMSVLGLLSLIGGIISLLFSFMPCVGALAILGGGVGIVLGFIGLRFAGSWNQGKGLPIAGIGVNALSILIAGAWLLFMVNASNKATLDEVETADAIQISAAQLCREFDTNVVKADETYKGKVLEVTGQVKLVSKERVGRITVELGNRDDTIDCDFGSSTQAELAGIELGKTVTIRGKCKGLDSKSGYVILGTCKLEKDAPSTPAAPAQVIKIDANKLLDDFDADEAAADKIYKGKVVEVRGEVSEVIDDDKKELILVFRGEEDPYLECRLTPEATKAAGKIRVGQKLTVRGTCAGLQDDDEFVLVENATIVK